MVVHLVERYKELYFKYKNASQYKLTINTVLSKLIPSFFAIITTVVGFSSLVLSNIEPVINLGLMMSVGILVFGIVHHEATHLAFGIPIFEMNAAHCLVELGIPLLHRIFGAYRREILLEKMLSGCILFLLEQLQRLTI